jgi:hypothetical protein
MRRKQRWVKIVALFIVGALILGVVATSLIVALSGKQSVIGTYAASDGRSLTLAKDGVATLKVPSVSQPLKATYKVEGDQVRIYEQGSTAGQGISFAIEGKDLVIRQGNSEEAWVRQEKK